MVAETVHKKYQLLAGFYQTSDWYCMFRYVWLCVVLFIQQNRINQSAYTLLWHQTSASYIDRLVAIQCCIQTMRWWRYTLVPWQRVNVCTLCESDGWRGKLHHHCYCRGQGKTIQLLTVLWGLPSIVQRLLTVSTIVSDEISICYTHSIEQGIYHNSWWFPGI